MNNGYNNQYPVQNTPNVNNGYNAGMQKDAPPIGYNRNPAPQYRNPVQNAANDVPPAYQPPAIQRAPMNDVKPAQTPNTTAPQKKKSGCGKKVGIAIAVILALILLAGIAVAAAIMIFSDKPYDKIGDALESGNYGEALDIYLDSYGDGKTDDKLTSELKERLISIENQFMSNAISYDDAIYAIEIIDAFGIPELESSIERSLSYIEAMNNSDSSGLTTETPTQDSSDNNLNNNTPTSYSPVISSAVTLNGTVLAASNTNSSRSFGADQAIDNNPVSCWCVNTTSTGGAGAQIRFNLREPAVVSKIEIVNGNLYLPEDDIYLSNGQIENFTLTFSDGTRLSGKASYNNTGDIIVQSFELTNPIETSYIILTVDSGYAGAKYTTNVCLGEFRVY